eukprot:11431377-Prorocentrum_lima.AAC.1
MESMRKSSSHPEVTQGMAWKEPPGRRMSKRNSHPRHLGQGIDAANDSLDLQEGDGAQLGDIHEGAHE